MKTNRPQKFWQEFRDQIYAGQLPLPEAQERQCSLAFYAGMLACFAESNLISTAEDLDVAAADMHRLLTEIAAAAGQASHVSA